MVHSTPVGSAGRDQPQQRVLPEWTPAPGTFVLDMVYKPVRTALLRDVETAEGVPVSGLEMFLTQAAAQIELFTGERPEEDELRRYLAGVKSGPTLGPAASSQVRG